MGRGGTCIEEGEVGWPMEKIPMGAISTWQQILWMRIQGQQPCEHLAPARTLTHWTVLGLAASAMLAVGILLLSLAPLQLQSAASTLARTGCTSPLALNYDSLARRNDGSCLFVHRGCTVTSARNYDPLAHIDDGSCQPHTWHPRKRGRSCS